LKQKKSLHMLGKGMFGYGDKADKQQQSAAEGVENQWNVK
jgi:hypothetical protein